MTIRFISLFFECSLIELFKTKAAHKMLWMEFSEHSSYASPLNRFMTTSTETTSESMIVVLTVWETIMFIE